MSMFISATFLALVAVIVICTVVMVVDFHVKRAKYSQWKARPSSGPCSPTAGCLSWSPERGRLFPSLSTISDYVPLLQVLLTAPAHCGLVQLPFCRSVPRSGAR